MKKTFLVTLALALAGASNLMATGTAEVFITGSTAFRANVYTACTKLFVGSAPTIYYGDAAHGGDANYNSKTAAWVMSGTPITQLTNLQGNTLIIHGLFTGSVQGTANLEQQTPLTFPSATAGGTPNGLVGGYVTNTPTIAFSDADSTSTPYPYTVGNFAQEPVAVQPFVFCKSGKPPIGAVTNINNVSWEQLEYGIPQGRIPLSSWTSRITDTNSFVYLLQRTSDSGTRRCETAGEYYQFGDPVGIYIYDYTNNFWYTPTATAATAYGASPNGVVGAAGLNNANLNWGYGYVAGGDIKNSLNNPNAANQAIAMLSMADSQGVGSSNWANVVSFNGLYPTAAGAGIHGNSTLTNDYSPITLGYYPLWGVEVVVYPNNLASITDQKITQTQFGTQTSPGTFMGVFNSQTIINGGLPLTGSIENEIYLSESGGSSFPATAIRLSEMVNSRNNVGGIITPPFN